ncbi:MAG: hypothetical protein LBG58_00695 [Planctomycetaceae bacterium]|nr:hypothetical protein [Planctomycetaceae bacterium]
MVKKKRNYSVEEGCAGWFVIVLYAVGLSFPAVNRDKSASTPTQPPGGRLPTTTE